MFSTILVPTDGSAGAEVPVAHAIDLARTDDASVHALYVVDTRGEPAELQGDEREALYTDAEQRGREATIRVTNRVEAHDLSAARSVREGVPHREILAYTDELDVDLVVMGTHGRSGAERPQVGSTTERVVRLADVPVLSVRLTDEESDPIEDSIDADAIASTGLYDTVVIPTDGSDAAEYAAQTALDVAERYGADVHTVYVIDETVYSIEDAPRSIVGLLRDGGREATETVAELARDRSLSVTTAVRRGVPAEELLAYVSTVDADLLAMGTRGQTGDGNPLLGSTTARVLGRSPIPVLAVTPS